MINVEIQDLQGVSKTIEIPEGIALSLMEVLKASEYPILATCGGLALCATCHVEVLHAGAQLGNATEAELEMLDTLPNAAHSSRLACQIRVGDHLNGAAFRLKGEL
jgi:ferredoxin